MLKENPNPWKMSATLDVCLRCRRETHMVMEGLGPGADFNETASE